MIANALAAAILIKQIEFSVQIKTGSRNLPSESLVFVKSKLSKSLAGILQEIT